jgi:hypothetical protein
MRPGEDDMANGLLIPVVIRALRKEDHGHRSPPQSSDVLYDADGHAHHRTCGMGIVAHEFAHELDSATFIQVRRGRDQVVWIADGRLEVLGFEFVGQRNPSKPTGHPGHKHAHAVAAVGTTPSMNLFPNMKVASVAEFDGRVVISGVTAPDAPFGFYKATFRLNNHLTIDPDLEITP